MRKTLSSRVAGAVIGGWQTGGILTLQSGMPGNLGIAGIACTPKVDFGVHPSYFGV